MNRVLRAARVLSLMAGVALLAQPAFAKPDFTQKERKKCSYCHEGSWSSGKLTRAGRYYEEHRTLKGFPQPQASHEQARPAPPRA